MRGVIPDVVTDQTSAHEALMYVPSGLSVAAADELRKSDPEEYKQRQWPPWPQHVQAMLEFQRKGAEVFDYGNNLRQQAFNYGVTDAFEFPGFVPAYIRPLVLRGQRPLPLGGALRRPRGYLPHRRSRRWNSSPKMSTCIAG